MGEHSDDTILVVVITCCKLVVGIGLTAVVGTYAFSDNYGKYDCYASSESDDPWV